MSVLHIKPIFAAFSFPTKADARGAFALVNASKVRDLYSCAMQDVASGKYVVAILGERQENVDAAARVVMAAPNCEDNFVLSKPVMTSMMNRRYGELAEAIDRGESVVSSRRSWAAQGGMPIDIHGKEAG